MTDSVAVFSPGTRITDNATGAVVSGALLEFYDADTTNPKTVYADKELATPLGTSVTCDSLGYPTSDGTTKTQIYVGTPAYKIVAKTSAGVVIWAHDNISGAVKVIDPGDLSVIATTPVVTKSLNYIIVPEDQSTEFVGNCSSGDVTFTLPSAVDVGDGWFVSVQHAGSANQVLINSTSSQTISSGSANYATVLPLSLSGESVKITSDGGNWRPMSAAAVAVATPCWPAPVSAMTRVLPIRLVSRAWAMTLLILCEPVWLRSSRLSSTRQPSSSDSRWAWSAGWAARRNRRAGHRARNERPGPPRRRGTPPRAPHMPG